jgi:hypothetical protein
MITNLSSPWGTRNDGYGKNRATHVAGCTALCAVAVAVALATITVLLGQGFLEIACLSPQRLRLVAGDLPA